MTTVERLVYMADQIARNMKTMAPDDAAIAVADHIASFWDPRMKALILAHLDSGGAGLSDVARAAIVRLRDAGAPPPQTQATVFAGGGSDAG
jgi:formate dehydrogenase subunit delta